MSETPFENWFRNEPRLRDVTLSGGLKGAEALQIRADILQFCILRETEVYLAEALRTLTFPEAYGLEDPESRGKALRKLRNEIEAVQEPHEQRAGAELFLIGPARLW